MIEEDQLTDEIEDVDVPSEEVDESTEEVDDLDTSSDETPVYKWDKSQLEELKSVLSSNKPSPAEVKQPVFDEQEFRRQVGYTELSEIEMERMTDPSVPVQERKALMDKFQRGTFESAVRASNYLHQQELKDLKDKASRFEQLEYQRHQAEQGQKLVQKLYTEYPGLKSYEKLVKLASDELVSQKRQFQNPDDLVKWIAKRTTEIGKEFNMSVDPKKKISTQKKAPSSLKGGQAGVVGKEGKKVDDKVDPVYAAYQRSLQRQKAANQ